MGFYKSISTIIICLFFSTFLSYANFPSETKNAILFQLSNKKCIAALEKYSKQYETNFKHDLNLLNKIAEQILIQGSNSSDEYIQKSCILGASWSGSSNISKILMKGILSTNPNIQLLTINSLDNCRSQIIREILIKSMASNFLAIRLEAAYKLALLQDAQVIDYLHSIFNQLPIYLQKQLNKIFIHIDHSDAHTYIKRYFGDQDVSIRAETAILTGIFQKDIFLPQLRNLVTRPHPIEQEAALFALGELKDQTSYLLMKKLLDSKYPNVKISAAIALAKIGKEPEVKNIIVEAIKQHHPYAISALSHFSSSSAQDILLPLMSYFSEEEKINALYVLLHHGFTNETILNDINDFLISDEYNLTASYALSPGKTITYVTLNNTCHLDENKLIDTTSTQYIKEKLLKLIFQISDDSFLFISESILNKKKKHLIPLLSKLLVNKNTSKVQNILNTSSQSLGAPLTRIYASLSLYKMTGDDQYKQILIDWLKSSAKETLIILEQKDIKNFSCLNKNSYFSYSLNLEEKTSLFINILDTLLQNKETEDIFTLINLILNGHPKNLYLLTGLLIKSLE